MKIKHRVPVAHLPKSDAISAEYQAEVDLATARAEARYRRAEQRIQRDEDRLVLMRAKKSTTKRVREIAELEAIVELRRLDLLRLHQMLVASPASSMHRGTAGGHRHIPSPGVF